MGYIVHPLIRWEPCTGYIVLPLIRREPCTGYYSSIFPQ